MEEALFSGEGEKGHQIVIVGAGIGGLATALALHRKGFKDVAIYERSESLRVEGTALGIYANGWRALDQLGVGNQLRQKALLLQGAEDVCIDQGTIKKMPHFDRTGELRCLKRSDLMNALSDALPPDTIQFGYNVVAVEMDDPQSMSPVIHFNGGKVVRAKALIGCDGSTSKVAEVLGLKPSSLFKTLGSVRGMTYYPKCHSFPPIFVRMRRHQRDGTLLGRLPINDNLVYWFVVLSNLDGKFPDDPQLIKQETLGMTEGFPVEAAEMIEKSDLDSLSFTHVRYRHPLEILVGKFHQGSVTILGDAMHLMSPYTGQGASAALEDAVVLVRNLSKKISSSSTSLDPTEDHKMFEEAMDQYVRERRMRILHMSLQTYLIGVILDTRSSMAKFITIIVMIILFRDQSKHTRYNCCKL